MREHRKHSENRQKVSSQYIPDALPEKKSIRHLSAGIIPLQCIKSIHKSFEIFD